MGWTSRLFVAVILISLLPGCSRPVGQEPPVPPINPQLLPPDKPQAPEVAKPLVPKVAATAKVELRFGDAWVPVSPLSSFISAGGGEVRLTFSKPVPAPEVERALNEMQLSPVRGRILWEDEQTLIWQIAVLPQRLDFLLDGVRDFDGFPLSGGIPSILIGDPPQLVEVDIGSTTEMKPVVLPPDIAFASLSDDRLSLNFHSWRPGVNQWDWNLVGQHLDLTSGVISPGLIKAAPPRLVSGVEGWQVSPDRSLVAGFRVDHSPDATGNPVAVDLVITDLRGGRQTISLGFVSRLPEVQRANSLFHLSWSPNGRQLVALSHRQGESPRSDLVVYDVSSGKSSVLVADIPVPAHTVRLNWSSDGTWVLVGNRLVELATKQTHELKGNPELSRGIWEPAGTRLLYSLDDWGEVMIVQPEPLLTTPIGLGLVIDWTGPDCVALIRWPGSDVRYIPPGW